MFAFAILAGVIATNRSDWWRYSVCALGTHVMSHSPWVFNAGILMTAALFALLASQSREMLRMLRERGVLTRGQVLGVVAIPALIAIDLAIVALVPYDVSSLAKLVHNVAGWGSGWVIAAAMFLVPSQLHVFDERFYTRTWLLLGVYAACFTGFEAGVLTYAMAEIGAISVAAAWTVLLYSNLERLGERAPATR